MIPMKNNLKYHQDVIIQSREKSSDLDLIQLKIFQSFNSIHEKLLHSANKVSEEDLSESLQQIIKSAEDMDLEKLHHLEYCHHLAWISSELQNRKGRGSKHMNQMKQMIQKQLARVEGLYMVHFQNVESLNQLRNSLFESKLSIN